MEDLVGYAWKPNGFWYQLQDSSVATMEFSGVAINALGTVTMEPAYSKLEKYGNFEAW